MASTLRCGALGRFWPYRTGAMQDPGCELRRIILPRTSVNRSIRLEGEENSRPSVGLHTFADQFLRIIVAFPTADLRFLVAFETLVDLKELLDLAQVLLRQVLQGSYVRKARVVVGDRQHVVLIAFGVSYVQRSDRAGPHHAAGEGRIVGGYHNVQGVAAIGARGGHETVVCGVAYGSRQDPVSHDDPRSGSYSYLLRLPTGTSITALTSWGASSPIGRASRLVSIVSWGSVLT